MRRRRHSRSIPQAPPCGLCFLGRWLMSYDLKRNLDLKPTNRPSASLCSWVVVRSGLLTLPGRHSQRSCEGAGISSGIEPRPHRDELVDDHSRAKRGVACSGHTLGYFWAIKTLRSGLGVARSQFTERVPQSDTSFEKWSGALR